MALPYAALSVIIILVACCCTAGSDASKPVTASEPTYAMLAAYKGQWTIGLSNGQADQLISEFTPFTCNYTDISDKASCLWPAKREGDGNAVAVSFSLKDSTAAFRVPEGLTPTEVEVKMCYSAYSYTDRPWRKKNRNYPAKDANCKFKISRIPIGPVLAAGGGTVVANFDHLDQVPTASFWFMVRTFCDNGLVCQWDSTEKANYVGTEVVMGITPGMVAAAVILSILGPVFLVGYWTADTLHYRKKGRPLSLVARS